MLCSINKTNVFTTNQLIDNFDHLPNMDIKVIETCCGCLNNGRTMIEIREVNLKQCFSEIINETPKSHFDRNMLKLCFECTALLLKFTKFKLQVVASYKTFKQYVKLNVPYAPYTRLHTKHLYNISSDIPQSTDELTKVEDIKIENYIEDSLADTVKEEESSAHEDEEPIIKVKRKKKKPKSEIKRERVPEYVEVELNRVEIEEERRIISLSEDYVNAMYRCERCITSFPNEDDLKDHTNIKHNLNASNYKCSICACSFSTEVSFNYHQNKHSRRYQCMICQHRFVSKRTAQKHYNVAHCHGTGMEYDYENNITEQDNVKESEDINTSEGTSFPCEFCAKIFKWKTSLRKHLETHRIETGQKRKPYCAPCRLSFTTTSNLQKHVRTSSKHQVQLKLRKLTENTESKDTERHKAQLDEIRSSVTSSRHQYPCNQCDKRFLWRGNLLRHLQSHAAKAKGDLVCKPCNRTFSSIATYQQHMKISKKHASENDFKFMCSDCGKRYPTKSRLRDHINWDHLKNFVYNCDECQKVFKTSNSVYLHKQAVHKKDSVEHLCDHCGKPFPNNAKLRNHIVGIHSGGASHQCGWCDARFSWHSCLSRHVRQKHRKLKTS